MLRKPDVRLIVGAVGVSAAGDFVLCLTASGRTRLR